MVYGSKGEIARSIADHTKAIALKPDYAEAYTNRAIVWLHLREWEKAKSDLTIVRDMGVNIIALFQNSYLSVADFEQRYNVQMPEDLAAMLTPPQA